jgi:hypothetical protein
VTVNLVSSEVIKHDNHDGQGGSASSTRWRNAKRFTLGDYGGEGRLFVSGPDPQIETSLPLG